MKLALAMGHTALLEASRLEPTSATRRVSSKSGMDGDPMTNGTTNSNGDERMDLVELWNGLIARRFSVLEGGHSAEECFLKLRKNEQLPAFDQRRSSVLRRVLAGESQKSVAIEMKRTTSTIASTCARVLTGMGVLPTVSKAPILLVLAAHAASGIRLLAGCIVATNSAAETIAMARRPDQFLGSQLPAAEFAVTRDFLEGRSHAQIAALRGTSERTVANQLASVFRRLRVSGRSELLHKLVCSMPTPRQEMNDYRQVAIPC